MGAQASMMSLLEKINADLKKAMLARDEITRETLRMLKSELLTLENPDETAVLSRAVKSRRDSAQSYREGGREDLAEKEEAEIAVIQTYLPTQLTEDQAREAITAVVAELGAAGKKDLGKVMKEVMARHRGQIDGKLASSIAGQLLD
ncbi:MAG: GatB/YqeY domain-containing protein [Myxococcales bacterium]|nr:GatB/YqeY domain-containing protein [Myxococcales bacterium]MDH3842807.1 GatB/YqeY domain-containing protein [Myxococcales bacterium]